MYCLASRLASLASPGHAEQEQVLTLATDLLARRNDTMLPEGSSAEDGLTSSSDDSPSAERGVCGGRCAKPPAEAEGTEAICNKG